MGLVIKRTVSAVDLQREEKERLTRGASFGCALLQSSETTHRVLTGGLDVLNALGVAVEPADYDKEYKRMSAVSVFPPGWNDEDIETRKNSAVQ
jgi:hypothetical protein